MLYLSGHFCKHSEGQACTSMVCPCLVLLFLNCLALLLAFLASGKERRMCRGYPLDLVFQPFYQGFALWQCFPPDLRICSRLHFPL